MPELQNEPLTFEKVWAALMENREQMKETDRMFRENREQMKETDRMFRETREQMKETERQMKETDRQMQETDRQMQETDRRMKETDRRMKETDRKIGDLSNRFGEIAEHMVLPGIVEKFNNLGFHFSDASQPHKFFDSKTGRTLAEVDILLENGDIVIAVEVKAKLSRQDVDDHLARMEFLRRRADSRGDSRKYRGAVAGAIVADDARQYARKAGLYVIEQSGDTMKLEIPKGFVPRDW
jgi:hypothetical protein